MKGTKRNCDKSENGTTGIMVFIAYKTFQGQSFCQIFDLHFILFSRWNVIVSMWMSLLKFCFHWSYVQKYCHCNCSIISMNSFQLSRWYTYIRYIYGMGENLHKTSLTIGCCTNWVCMRTISHSFVHFNSYVAHPHTQSSTVVLNAGGRSFLSHGVSSIFSLSFLLSGVRSYVYMYHIILMLSCFTWYLFLFIYPNQFFIYPNPFLVRSFSLSLASHVCLIYRIS